MGFWKDFGTGFTSFFKAIGFVFSNGLWWVLVFPLLFNVLLFWGGNELVSLAIGKINSWITGIIWLNDESTLYFTILKGLFSGIIWLLLKILFFTVFAYVGGYLVLIIMSPVLAYLAEKTEKKLTGSAFPFSGEQWMRNLIRGIIIVLRNLLIETLIVVIILFLTLIPVLGWLIALISPVILLIVSAYFYGFSFMDYTLELKKMTISRSVGYVRKHKGIALSTGLIFALFMILPFCGNLLSPFISVFSVVGATLAVNRVEKII